VGLAFLGETTSFISIKFAYNNQKNITVIEEKQISVDQCTVKNWKRFYAVTSTVSDK
jgi:hypothetical protein